MADDAQVDALSRLAVDLAEVAQRLSDGAANEREREFARAACRHAKGIKLVAAAWQQEIRAQAS